jgi:hypothetical protein
VLLASVIIGFFLPSNHEGNPDPTYRFWLLGLGQYLFVYVFYANEKGAIHAPYTANIVKTENLVLFRFLQFIYGVVSVILCISVVNYYI